MLNALYKNIKSEDFLPILSSIQKQLTSRSFEILSYSGSDNKEKILAFISKYIRDNSVNTSNINIVSLSLLIYNEIKEYSVLTELLLSDLLEEININAWNDIQLKYRDGSITKTTHFFSPQHGIDILKRLLAENNVVIDGLNPTKESHITYGHNRIRITAAITPIVDERAGLSCSLRILNGKPIPRDVYLSTDFISVEGLSLLEQCLSHGVSMIIAGRVGSGKTSFQNFLLSCQPDDNRIYTIETGSRELDLVRYDENGNVVNNVVHTLTRHHENPQYSINQEDLIIQALRFNADVVSVAEVRDTEAYASQEASVTGNTVITTLHAGNAEQAHNRIAELCRKKYSMDYDTAMLNAARAFPIVVFIHTLNRSTRKVMSITECVIENNRRVYKPLFRYQLENGTGSHIKVHNISDALVEQLQLYGIPQEKLRELTA